VLFVSSFTDLTEKIIDRATQVIFNSEIDQNNFNQMLQMTKNLLLGSKNDQPFEKAINIFTQIIKNQIFSHKELLGVIDKINYKDFVSEYKNIQKTFYVTSQFYGNLNEKQLLTIESYFQPYLNQDINPVAKRLKIKDNSIMDYIHHHNKLKGSFVYRHINDLKTELNSAILNLFQIGKRDTRNSLIMNLIELSWGNMFFFNLRTQKQFGYIVSASKFLKDNYMYFMFLVQGSKATPATINIEIDTVIRMARNRLEELEDDQLAENKETLIAEISKRENNLKERSDYVWKEIYENSQDFNRRYDLIEELKFVTKQDLIETFDNIFYINVNKLSVQLYSQYDYEEAIIQNNETTEIYNLNSNIKSFVTNDLKILKSEIKNREKKI
jgi:insulysin